MPVLKVKPFEGEGGGGGTTYTAGNGIEITDENVINADVKVIETSNITGLTTEQCESLNVGDVVSTGDKIYIVNNKITSSTPPALTLTYTNFNSIQTVMYGYINSSWVYVETKTKDLIDINYYKHIIDIETNDPTQCYSGRIRVEIINTNNYQFDYAGLLNYLGNNGFVYENPYPCLEEIDSCLLGGIYFNDNTGGEDCITTSRDGMSLTEEYPGTIRDTVIEI